MAKEFKNTVNLTGIILTRADGDARGGAALSMKYVSQVPIKFLGVGEKIENLEVFHPDRIANRILGMGDIVSLVEKAAEDLEKVAERIANLPEINGVIILLGRFDILAIGLFEGLSEVHQVASNKILDFEGVRLVETSVVVDVVKYDNRVAKIVTPHLEKI